MGRRLKNEIYFQIAICYIEMEEFKLSIHFHHKALERDPFSWKDNYSCVYSKNLYFLAIEKHSTNNDLEYPDKQLAVVPEF